MKKICSTCLGGVRAGLGMKSGSAKNYLDRCQFGDQAKHFVPHYQSMHGGAPPPVSVGIS